MLLVWLEADTILRQKSGGKRSLDDFCSRFFGGETGAPTVKTYTRADVVSALDAVATYDWAAFFSARIDAVSARAPLGGIEDSGWRVVYGDTPNGYLAARAKVAGAADFGFSLGIWTKPDGTVADVVHGSPAFTAGLAPAMRITAIDGRKWSTEAAEQALERAEKTPRPLEIVVEAADIVRTVRIDYHDGLRHPHLERDPAKPDLLGAILAPRSAPAP